VKRAEVRKRINKAAREKGLDVHEFEMTNHTGLTCGSARTVIPRHAEIAEGTAETIFKQLEPALGRRWWRK
jgi:hypothetical protein